MWRRNSKIGYFGYMDLQAVRFKRVAFCPGHLRGLTFWGNKAIVDLLKPRASIEISPMASEIFYLVEKPYPVIFNLAAFVHQLLL
ncbi:DUF4915 domain-containing protein [Lyngbya aestuarii]|uniref:DUF4915 domain-containing protein n=1 Tax=Lyngbya aestuarii TaxID=118322 RepID=UPI00403E31A4